MNDWHFDDVVKEDVGDFAVDIALGGFGRGNPRVVKELKERWVVVTRFFGRAGPDQWGVKVVWVVVIARPAEHVGLELARVRVV